MPIGQREKQLPREFAKAIVWIGLGMGICWWIHSKDKPEDPWLSGGIIKVEREVLAASGEILEKKVVAVITPVAAGPDAEAWWLMPGDEDLSIKLQDNQRLTMVLVKNTEFPQSKEELCQNLGPLLTEVVDVVNGTPAQPCATPHTVRTVQTDVLQAEEWTCPE